MELKTQATFDLTLILKAKQQYVFHDCFRNLCNHHSCEQAQEKVSSGDKGNYLALKHSEVMKWLGYDMKSPVVLFTQQSEDMIELQKASFVLEASGLSLI